METVKNITQTVSEKLSDFEDYIVKEWLTGWTASQIPSLHGKTALVTGANSGLGFEITRKLAENGCKVLMVSRDLANGETAARDIRLQIGKGAQLEVLQCDLLELKNVVPLIQEVKRKTDKLDILVNNAGVFHPGPYMKSAEGIEQSLAVNFYSHALLTLGLLDLVRAASGRGRILYESSPAETFGKLDWSNLTGQRYKDSGMVPYGTSKLYSMMFFKELSMRVPDVDFFMTQPGVSLTPLQNKASLRYWTAALVVAGAQVAGNTPYQGATPALYAATEPSLTGKGYAFFGPNRINMYYTTERQPISRPVHNPVSCWKLFEESVRIIKGIVGDSAPITVPPHPEELAYKSVGGVATRGVGERVGERVSEGVGAAKQAVYKVAHPTTTAQVPGTLPQVSAA